MARRAPPKKSSPAKRALGKPGKAAKSAAPRSARPAKPRLAAAPTAPVRIARVSKGKKPQYFSDPAIDKLLWISLTLMEELSVTRDRLDTVERLLDSRRVLRTRDIESYTPTEAAARERSARRTAYVDRVLRAAQAELEEITGRDMPASESDVIAAVEA